ncbi:MAG TPA: DNA/RNA non-specific endonuclease, partial [Candidatus Binatia bacterium]|nr:DNA/RNA non-specific endonuclease [Candidatus Binatia bacterium]
PDFSIDERTFMHVRSEDYARSGYDRGHMAPNYLMAKLYGAEAQRASFLMSNVVPQRHRLNVLVWQRLEEAEADLVAPRMGELWVVTGPVFAAQPKSLRSGIAVPEAFYRIWLAPPPSGREPRALAFLVPQEVCGTEPLSRYLASVDAIEERTGLDFFPELDAAAQARIEAGVESDGWELQRWERQPPRYAKEFRKLDCRESGAVDAAGIGRTR